LFHSSHIRILPLQRIFQDPSALWVDATHRVQAAIVLDLQDGEHLLIQGEGDLLSLHLKIQEDSLSCHRMLFRLKRAHQIRGPEQGMIFTWWEKLLKSILKLFYRVASSQPSAKSMENPTNVEGFCTPLINRKLSMPLSSIERSDSGISSYLGCTNQVCQDSIQNWIFKLEKSNLFPILHSDKVEAATKAAFFGQHE